MPVFDKTGTGSLNELRDKLACILDQLHPGSRHVLGEIDVPRDEDLTPAVHLRMFETEPILRSVSHVE